MVHDAYIISAARTPIGSFLGSLKSVPAPQLGSVAIRAAMERCQLEPTEVDEVIMGCVITAGMGQAPARQAALQAGLPVTVPAVTINKVCGSGLKAIMLAAQAIRAGDAKILVAGGMENMSRAPHFVEGLREGQKLGDLTLRDTMVFDGLICAFEQCHMGSHAEHIAATHGVSREEQDQFAAESQRRAAAAMTENVVAREIAAVTVKTRRDELVIQKDECVRPDTTLSVLAGLKPVFSKEGTVTAGNASTLSDGAAAVIVTDRDRAERSDSNWKARVVSYHTSGMEPKDLFYAPVAAVQGALAKAKLTVDQIDLFEINEAFASQMVACIRGLKIDAERVNIFGGGISLGHPIGASGARTVVTLLNAMQHRQAKRGVVSLCLGGGNAVAMVIER